MGMGKKYGVLGLYYFNFLKKILIKSLECGEIGIVSLGLKSVMDIVVGDTFIDVKNPIPKFIEGFMLAKSFVFVGLYSIETDRFEDLREVLLKF